MITALFSLLDLFISLYVWALILSAVFSLLSAFGVLDTRNRLVWTVGDFLYRVTEPVLRPIRDRLPNLGGVDISPIVVIGLLQLVVQPLLHRLRDAILYGAWQGLLL